jgi:hypothetical protein
MPFELDLETREIYSVDRLPVGTNWIPVTFKIQRLVNDQHPHDIEWEKFEPIGIYNITRRIVAVNDYETAFDIEYYTRGGCRLTFVQN